jgi:hypothetical protein
MAIMVAEMLRVSGMAKAASGCDLKATKKSWSKLRTPMGEISRLRGFSRRRLVMVPIMPSLIPRRVKSGTRKATVEKIEQAENSQSRR